MWSLDDDDHDLYRSSRFDSDATMVDFLPTLKKGSISKLETLKESDIELNDKKSPLDVEVYVFDPSSTTTIKWYTLTQKKKELIAAFSLTALGALNDSASSSNINSMQSFYEKSDDELTCLFFFNIAGYLAACLLSSFITQRIGLRYSLLMGGGLLSLGCLTIALTPPYALFIMASSLLGAGGGTLDSNLTTVISHYESPLVMSIFFGMYGIGALLSPILSGTLLDAGMEWNTYYFIPLGLQVTLSIIVFPVFANYKVPEAKVELSLPTATPDTKPVEVDKRSNLRQSLSIYVVWIGFLLNFLTLGQGDMLTSWLVAFLIDDRAVSIVVSRYELSGYWCGIAFGQIVLAFFGNNIKEKTFCFIALGAAAICALLLWLVQNNTVEAISLALLGCFLGPVSPKVFSMVNARTPTHLKGLVMSLLLSVGLVGACIVPICFSLTADRGALEFLPAVLMSTCILAAVAWTLVPSKTLE